VSETEVGEWMNGKVGGWHFLSDRMYSVVRIGKGGVACCWVLLGAAPKIWGRALRDAKNLSRARMGGRKGGGDGWVVDVDTLRDGDAKRAT
jgi:hypothetical protein